MRVAFATMGGHEKIDAHFGAATAFAIYDVTPDNVRFIGMIHLSEHFIEDDKVEGRAAMLRECAVVYCAQIGGPAAARLVQQNIHPLKVKEGTPIEDEVNRFQTMLQGNPPPFLRKRLAEEMKNKEETF